MANILPLLSMLMAKTDEHPGPSRRSGSTYRNWHNIWPLGYLVILLIVSVLWIGFLGYEAFRLARFLF